MIEWIETAKTPPAMGKVVMGFWPTASIQTVICHDDDRWNAPGYIYSEYRSPPEYWAEVPNLPPGYDRGEESVSGGIEMPIYPPTHTTFKHFDCVMKKSGGHWRGRVVGWYSTDLTPEGYAVESMYEPGSVQIYPATALVRMSE